MKTFLVLLVLVAACEETPQETATRRTRADSICFHIYSQLAQTRQDTFTVKMDCVMLTRMDEVSAHAKDAENSGAVSAGMSGAAIGFAAGSRR